MRILISAFLGGLLISASAAAQGNDERMELFDEQIAPLVEELAEGDGPPDMYTTQELMELVQRFNNGERFGVRPVESLDPKFALSKLRIDEVTHAALALCGEATEGLRSCADAADHLRTMTAQCSNVFLGVIDLDEHPSVPAQYLQGAFYDADGDYRPGDPNFILFKVNPAADGLLENVRVSAAVNPDTVAIVLCPEESDAFGPAMRALGMTP